MNLGGLIPDHLHLEIKYQNSHPRAVLKKHFNMASSLSFYGIALICIMTTQGSSLSKPNAF